MARRACGRGLLVLLLLPGASFPAAASPERPAPPPEGLTLTIERLDTAPGPGEVTFRWTLANGGPEPVTLSDWPGFSLEEHTSPGEGYSRTVLILPGGEPPPAAPERFFTLAPGESRTGTTTDRVTPEDVPWVEYSGAFDARLDGSSAGRPSWVGRLRSRPVRVDLPGTQRRPPCLEPEPTIVELRGLLSEVAPPGRDRAWHLALEHPVCVLPPRPGFLGVYRDGQALVQLVLADRPYESLRPFLHRHVRATGLLNALPAGLVLFTLQDIAPLEDEEPDDAHGPGD